MDVFFKPWEDVRITGWANPGGGGVYDIGGIISSHHNPVPALWEDGNHYYVAAANAIFAGVRLTFLW
jgi:hypothetical protein